MRIVSLASLRLVVMLSGCPNPSTDAGPSPDDSGTEGVDGGADPLDARSGSGDAGHVDSGTPFDAGPGPQDGGGPADAGPLLINGCAEDARAACAYAPVVSAAPGTRSGSQDVVYTDVTGAVRTVYVEVRQPDPAPVGPSPVVVWSHGGAGGRDDPTTVAEEVGAALNTGGYISVHIAHPGRARISYGALCDEIGLGAADCVDGFCDASTPCVRAVDGGAPEQGACFREPDESSGTCGYFKHLNYDRPHDVRAVLDWIEDQNASGPLAGRFDLSRIAYTGHSAGGGAALMVAGATRNYAGVPTLLDAPRPIAFVSNSPQGPGEEDFVEASFTGAGCLALAPDGSAACLSRPHLVMTGEGDITEHIPAVRRQAYELMPPGDKYMAFVIDAAAQHNMFQLKADACTATPARCQDIQRALGGVLLAFLDAQLRDAPGGNAYLASDNVEVLLEDGVDFFRK